MLPTCPPALFIVQFIGRAASKYCLGRHGWREFPLQQSEKMISADGSVQSLFLPSVIIVITSLIDEAVSFPPVEPLLDENLQTVSRKWAALMSYNQAFFNLVWKCPPDMDQNTRSAHGWAWIILIHMKNKSKTVSCTVSSNSSIEGFTLFLWPTRWLDMQSFCLDI